MATVDNLDIQISANATNANRPLENLITTVTRLQSSFSGVNTSILTNTTASNQAATATNRLANAQQKAGRVAKSSSVSFAGLASIFGTIYANCFLAIRGIKALGNSIKSTADYIEAYNYFDVALGKIGEESKANFTEELGKELGIRTAEEYANSFSTRLSENLSTMSGIQLQIGEDGKGVLASTGIKNLGLNIQEVTQYASQLASVTNSVGQTGEVSLVAAEAFTKLGADMSSLFNMDYSQVMTNLQSGLIGQSRAELLVA